MPSATARVKLTIEMDASGSWGEGCQLSQVYRQGAEAALGRLRKVLANERWRVIGEPEVTAVMTEGKP